MSASSTSAIPTLVSPADGTLLSGTTTTINAIFTVSYVSQITQVTIWYATNDAFANATAVTITAPATRSIVNLVGAEGAIVYWKARASLPFQSGWSEVWTVEIPVVTPVNAPVPAYPAGDDITDISLTPMLNWSSFRLATGYQVQVADNPDMTSPFVDAVLGNTTSYKISDSLTYSTDYWWRVRAIIGTATVYSDWSAIVGFTTMAEPVEPAPPIVIEPAPPAPVLPTPTTPAYIYAIIAIGAVLVIVVIVLIVRTRRP
jgi:hypothetical protein